MLCSKIEALGWHNPQENINIPTKFSAQILANSRTMYNQIEDFSIPEDLVNIFQIIVDEIADNYIIIFEKMNIQTRTTALRYFFLIIYIKLYQRVREELEYFVSDLKKIKVMSSVNFIIVDDRAQKIINDKCNYLLEATYL